MEDGEWKPIGKYAFSATKAQKGKRSELGLIAEGQRNTNRFAKLIGRLSDTWHIESHYAIEFTYIPNE